MNQSPTVYKPIEDLIKSLQPQTISKERRAILQPLIDAIQQKVTQNETIRLNFICTHNSRRSHLSQIWAQTVASYFNLRHVFCYSGGTEATALFPMVAETLKKSGFLIHTISEGTNPVYSIKYTD
ncbi:MAG: protein-tyrosine-phosphatase, partial [Winogradskyella sp.]|nr:protein-tyrosine-phosphatase [Winogradskyella sp.]